MVWQDKDQLFMKQALREAQKAVDIGEVPVGAVIVCQGKIISRGYNKVEVKQDATMHAELIAIRKAAAKLGTWRLEQCQLYVTLEPCAMCAGAITWSRIETVLYGADDPKAGAYRSAVKVLGNKKLNHRPEVKRGLLADKSSALLKAFFKELR